LTRPFDKHLDSDELDRLVSLQETSVSGSEQLSELALGEAQRHVESCQDCSRKLQRHKFVHSEILRMRVPNPSPPTPECMGDAEWLEVAAGLLPEAKTRALMKHAAQCGHCGPLLKSAAEALVDEATPSEEALLASLQSARPEWRKNMSATLRESVRDRQPIHPWWRTLFVWPSPAYALAAVAAVAIVAWMGMRTLRPPSAEDLLAQAYSEHRTLEVRIPGAKYAPMQAERGTEQSDFDKPASLLKAKDLIGEALSKNPNDPKWLQARARAELLDGNYESAIKSLHRTLETQPNSPSLLTDLGSAYFVRAESADRPIDYGNAIESLGKALAKSPDDPVALFNRALACERAFLYTQAVDDWEHYLRVDPQGEWAGEARSRLGALKEKLEGHKKSQNEPLLAPEQIAKAGVGDVTVRTKIDERFEDYLNVAVRDWLLQAYPTSNNSLTDAHVVRIALRELADIGRQKHNDNWLADLLAKSDLQLVPRAFEDLATAIKDNDKADTSRAQLHASEAARIFSSTRNEAGAMRAGLERLVAINIAQDGTRCMNAATNLKREAVGRPYPWLVAQIDNETGSCLFLLETLGSARSEYLNAVREADRNSYHALGLRARDHICVLYGASGDLQAGWSAASNALASFWSGAYPNLRGYNLYYGLYEFSREAGQPYLQMAAWRDGLALVETSPDTAQKAVAHSLMATAAQTAGETTVAEHEFARASELFSVSPQIASTRIAAIEAETRLAAIESTQGNFARAISRLRPLETEITGLSDNFLAILFYTTLGDAESKQGENQSADSSLRSAVNLAEVQLRSLQDDKSRIDWDRQSAGAYRNLVQLSLRRGDAQDALALWEWYRGAVLRSGRGSSGAATSLTLPMRDLQAQIPGLTKETVVSYALLPDGLATWVYDDRGITSRWTALLPDELEAKVTAFRRLCSRPDSDKAALDEESRALYESLVSPIEQELAPDRTLVVDLDTSLAGLPFDALLDGHDRYLSERFSIAYSLGIYYRSLARLSRAIAIGNSVLVVAVPSSTAVTGALVGALPEVTTEGEMIARSFRTATYLAGQEANAKHIHSALPGKSLFHFAGHALSSSGQTGLLLTDGLLTASSLKTVELADLDLAVFSACDTQDGSTGGLADADSLVRAFLRAGVPHVVASRWNVDSRASLQFMSSFYRALLVGNTVPDSIHHAQQDLRSNPRTAGPYYWSAFSAFGTL
jgi:CHAT domain-containing protein/cytochrome c-type biogenesis protein CcmH/NrfG